MPDESPRPGAPARVLTPRVVLVASLVAAVIAVPAGRYVKAWLWPTPLPVLSEVPAFTLTDQRGERFDSTRLDGRPWIASFIFTRCPSVCPLLTDAMRQVQDRTASAGDRLALVSFSIDPDHDTPEVLAGYARAHGADPARWSFLTGPREVIEGTVAAGLQVGITGTGPDLVPEQVIHGALLLLVDGEGRLRGAYDSAQPDGLDRLVRDALRLAKDARPAPGAGHGEEPAS